MSGNASNVVEYDFSRDASARQQATAPEQQDPHAHPQPQGRHAGGPRTTVSADLPTPAGAHAASTSGPLPSPPAGGAHSGPTPVRVMDTPGNVAHKKPPAARQRILLFAIIGCVCLAALIGAVVFFATAPINVTVNGQQVTVGGARTLEDAFVASGVSVKPGNLIAVDGSLLEEGAGNKFTATVNGDDESDAKRPLSESDTVVFANGDDVEEESTFTEEPLRYGATIDGTGAVHVIEGEGADGIKGIKTGSISGLTAESIVQQPTSVVCKRFNIDTGGEKVIALTFDDGPQTTYTSHILDILAANNAKATFFTVGTCITGDNVGVVQRAQAEGHQVATHTYDHADGSGQGVNLGYMSDEEIVEEVAKGYECIESATGSPASRCIRTPGGNFGENVIVNLHPLIDAEIGWNIDTHDWERPGAASIESKILSAQPGHIILMHDGGGDRSQTVEALRSALPKLAAQGYRFVTVDELLQYAA